MRGIYKIAKIIFQGAGAAAGLARASLGFLAIALCPGDAWAVSHYLTTVSKVPYAWETTANVLSGANFSSACTAKPIDDDFAVINFTGGLTIPFGYFAEQQSSVRMMSNGQLQFEADTGLSRVAPSSPLPPPAAAPKAGCPGGVAHTMILSVAGMDLNPAAGGAMSWEQKGVAPNRYVVFSWENVPFVAAGRSGAATFQAIVRENGIFEYQYKNITGMTWAEAAPVMGVQTNGSYYLEGAAGSIANGAKVAWWQLFGAPMTTTATTTNACGPIEMTVLLLNPYGGELRYPGIVDLTFTGGGNWTKTQGLGTFAPGPVDSGLATYSFVPGDGGTAKFMLSSSVETSGTASLTERYGYPNLSAPISINFTNQLLELSPSSVDVLDLDVVAGRPHAFRARLLTRNPVTNQCDVVDTSYSGTKHMDAWHGRAWNHPMTSTGPSISANSSCSSPFLLPSAAPATSAGSNNFNVEFVNGAGQFYLCASDVGRYSLNMRDDTLVHKPMVIAGSSPTVSPRPFGLWTSGVTNSSSGTVAAPGGFPNPGGTATSGSPFMSAGSSFYARVTAKNWVAGQDTVTPGIPDANANLSTNPTTLRFASPTSFSAIAGSQTPSLGSLGILAGAPIPAGSFASGSATSGILSYSEAGSLKMVAGAPSHLSAYAVPGVPSQTIGRFTPGYFETTASTVANGCVAGAFTYMDQPMNVNMTVKAMSAAGTPLSNYSSAWGYAYLMTPRLVGVINGTTPLNSARFTASTADPVWSMGTLAYTNYKLAVNKGGGNPDGPFNTFQLGITNPSSSLDTPGFFNPNMNEAGGSCGSPAICSARTVGSPTKILHGRLDISNALGSVLPTLRMPVKALYWNKTPGGLSLGWVPNTLDSCTSIPYNSVALGGFAGNLTSASVPASGNLALVQGVGVLLVTRPSGANVSGSVNVGVNLGAASASPGSCDPSLPVSNGANLAHLRSNFCAPTHNKNPNAKAVWGSANGKSGSVVFIRESY